MKPLKLLPSFEDIDRFVEAEHLTRDDIDRFYERINGDENDYEARLFLAAFYFRHHWKGDEFAEAFLEDLIWFIKNHPSNRIDCLCPQYYKARNLWFKQVRNHPKNPIVLANAAQFCELIDPKYSEKFWIRAQQADPLCAEWQKCLSSLNLRQAKFDEGVSKKRLLRKAIAGALKALELDVHEEEKDPLIIQLIDELVDLALEMNCTKELNSLLDVQREQAVEKKL